MNTTPNYGLKKPEQTDFYNVDDFNNNADIIDTQLKANADAAAAAETPSGAQAKADNAETNAKNFASGIIGSLASLLTTAKNTIVAAINELKTAHDAHLADKTNPHDVTAAQVGALVSIDGVSNAGGNVDFVPGTNIAITPNNTNKTVTIAGTGTWPTADKVDGIDFRVSSGRLQYSTNGGGTWNDVGAIKSVQRGLTRVSESGIASNVTISAVNLSKSFVTATYIADDGTKPSTDDRVNARVRLTSGTNLEVYGSFQTGGLHTSIAWEVVEFV